MTDALNLERLILDKGIHRNRNNGLCVMEAVAWLTVNMWRRVNRWAVGE